MDPKMPHFRTPQPDSTLDQLDRRPHELRSGHVLNLDAFRPQLRRASGPHTARQADTRRTDVDTKLRHELNLAFADLGGAAFALAHHGALNDKRLAPQLQRLHQLYAQLDALAHSTPVDLADDQASAGDVATS
jgi:hypothetical protein